MLPRFCRDTVTVLRAPTRSGRGTDVADWDAAVPHEITGCSLQPASTSTDFADAGMATGATASLYLPDGSDIEAGDRVRAYGVDYVVLGNPMPVRSPTGRIDHINVLLSDWG